MNFDDVSNEFNKALEEDCANIIKEIDNFKINVLKSEKNISFNAFNKIIPITLTSQQTTYEFTELKNESGIYVFVINSECVICEGFNKPDSCRAKLRKQKTSFSKGDILYIGKCGQLDSRMKSHLDDSVTNKVSSLKLTTPERKNLIGNFTIYSFCLRAEYKNYYSMIATKVERTLRDKLNPDVGQ